MTDLHTHILPGMDDGARDAASAAKLLEMQLQQGVRQVALTSHYCRDLETAEAFLERRRRAFSVLCDAAPDGITLKQGAEVFFTPMLFQTDIRSLCLEGTDYLLLELPILQKPAFLKEYLLHLRSQGIVPLIAHAERYLYVQKNPALLTEWISLGALIQVNAGSMNGADGKFVSKLIKWGLVQVLSSDTHNAEYRPPDLRLGLEAAERSVGAERVRQLLCCAEAIFSGEKLPVPVFHTPKKILGAWI